MNEPTVCIKKAFRVNVASLDNTQWTAHNNSQSTIHITVVLAAHWQSSSNCDYH